MFEVGFSELLLVAVIGLLVLGPERLPVALRTATVFLGRLRRQYNEIRAEVEREIGADQIRADLHNARILDELKQSRAALDETRRTLEAPLTSSSPAPAPPPDA